MHLRAQTAVAVRRSIFAFVTAIALTAGGAALAQSDQPAPEAVPDAAVTSIVAPSACR